MLISAPVTRREMLSRAACGFGYLAFAAMAGGAAQALRPEPLAPRPGHFPARAKRVIFLFMPGGPSHVDTFDYKPKLQADNGKEAPDSVTNAGTGGKKTSGRPLYASPWKFARHGRGGLWMSELFPHLAGCADDLCMINGMYCDSAAHLQATRQMQTGAANFIRPSLGSWCLYGLGTMNDSLPGFVTIGGSGQSAFLPATFAGTSLAVVSKKANDIGAAVPNLINPNLPRSLQEHQIRALQELNDDLLRRTERDAKIDSVIQSYELAFKMQSAAPGVLDLAREPRETLDLYGIGADKPTNPFGQSCLLARRLAQAGVRFIQVSSPVKWDDHKELKTSLPRSCIATDQPIAALLHDLKRLGMLDDTLVVWGGEFGRQPMAQREDGRDHNNKGFTMWMAGGGVRGGMSHGMTDDYGYAAVQDKVHVHDLHATILHLLGIDHQKLTYRFNGRDFRLTDVYGNVVRQVLA